MKKFFLVLLLGVGLIEADYRVSVYDDIEPYRSLNFNNPNPKSNGEECIVRNFIKDNDIVFDIGANKGDWSDCVKKYVSNVNIYAFEPMVNVFQNLKNSNKSQTMHCFNCAISNKIGSRLFYYYSHHDGCSGFFERKNVSHLIGEVSNTLSVPTTTLDSFCDENEIERINFLKIDTEGAELEVLQGSQELLRAKKIDHIQFEYGGTYPDAGITLRQVLEIFFDSGYYVFRELPDGLVWVKEWTESRENLYYSNYFAISDMRLLDK